MLYFIFSDLRALANLWGRYGLRTEFLIVFLFTVKPESCLYYTVELLMLHFMFWLLRCTLWLERIMSHNVNSLFLSYTDRSDTFALIRVINRLVWRVGRVVHFLLQFIRHPNNHSGSGSGSGYVSSFFILHNFVNFSRRAICVISMESCGHRLYFVFLHLIALCNLRGSYDLKTEKMLMFCFNYVIPWHRIKCYNSLESCHRWLHFILHWRALAIYENIMTKYMKILWILTALCAVSFTISALSGFSLKLQANESIYSEIPWSGTPMGLARSVPLSEVSHLVKLAIMTRYWEHSTQIQFKFLFPNHTYMKYIKMSNELLWGRYRLVKM